MSVPSTFVAAVLTTALGAAAQAQGIAMNDDARQFYISGYLFASGVKGEVSTVGALPNANIDMSFRDVIGDLEGGIMGMAEYRDGPWTVMGDLMYTHVNPTGSLPGPAASTVELHQRQTTLQANALYRAYATPDVRVDLGVGLRYWHLDNTIDVSAGSFPTLSGQQKQDWFDPVLAVRFQTRLNDKWRATLFADYGGSGGGSDETWQVVGTLDYSMKENLLLRFGYRVLATDYRDGNFEYDITMRGPLLGLTYRF